MSGHSDEVLGQLTLSLDGAILQSSGSLENNEHVAKVVTKSLLLLSESHEEPFKRLSFLYSDHAYVVVKCGKSIKIVHKKVDEIPSL